MSQQDYLESIYRLEDRIETNTFLLCRRFERLGLNVDVLVLDFPIRDPETGEYQMEEIVFRNFTAGDMSAIQLGKLVSLLEGGLTNEQEERYRIIKGVFLGSYVICDYMDARNGHGDYTPEDVLRAAEEYGGFTELFYQNDLTFAIWLFNTLRGEKAEFPEDKTGESSPTPSFELPKDINEFLNRKEKEEPQIVRLSDIDKVDAYLRSKL